MTKRVENHKKLVIREKRIKEIRKRYATYKEKAWFVLIKNIDGRYERQELRGETPLRIYPLRPLKCKDIKLVKEIPMKKPSDIISIV